MHISNTLVSKNNQWGSSKIYYGLLFFLTQFIVVNIFAQTTVIKDSSDKNTTLVIPGKHYVRSGYHNLFWGKHYRKEWGTPIRVNNFFLDTAYGGLTPSKESGSRQSMGLRLKGKNGKEYVLRSIDKDFGNGLGDMYKGTFVSKVAKDQASFGYPLAAITITPMIAATGIYHTNPKVVFVPKQNSLGEFNEKYGDQLYLFEERPDDDQHDAPWFGNAEKVISSKKLYENIFEDNDKSVDQLAFAKARLFDMFIGDWGRHADQWRWASFKNDGKTIYRPIPRDRDQAYTKFDGLYPSLITGVAGAPHLESFSGNIKKIQGFNLPAHDLDQQFTNAVTEAQWVNAAKELQAVLTDSLIEYSMHMLPDALYDINGDKIVKKLKSRRDHLQDFAHRYYKLLAKNIFVYGTDDKEMFDITRKENNETVIDIYKIKKDNTIETKPFYSRTIYAKETKSVHLFGFKDDDVFKINGHSNDGVKIRLIGVTKSDTIIGNTDNKVKVYKGRSDKYDSVFQKRIKISPVILASPKVYKVFEEDALKLFTRPGVHLGLNIAYRPIPWKRDSLETVHNVAVIYGVLRKIFYIDYVGIKPNIIGKWDLLLKAKYDAPAAENYYGIGNETRDSAGVSATYYNVFSKRLYGGIGVKREFNHTHFVDATIFYQNIMVNKNVGNYIQQKENALPVFQNNNYVGVEVGYRYSNTNSNIIPTKGINFSAAGGYVLNAKKTNASFLKGLSEISVYVPLGKVISFAVRAGGATVSGDANYYHLSKLGGNENLRGYARERFYGKTSFYSNNEIRLITNTRNYFFSGKIGLVGFYDNGRIWQPGENSNTWHMGYGGGIILVPYNKVALCATYGKSNEGTHVLLKASMFF